MQQSQQVPIFDEETCVIMEETIEPDYNPTVQGMDPIKDKNLLWIAKEGLKAPLPPNWKPCQTPNEEIFYHNFQTKVSTLTHPCDEYYKELYEKEKRKRHLGGSKHSSLQKKQSKKLSPQTLGKKSLKSISKIGTLSKSKYEDPIIKREMEKKLNNFRKQLDENFQKQKQEMEEAYKEREEQLKKEHEDEIVNLNDNYEANKQLEKERIEAEIENAKFNNNLQLDEDLKQFEEDLREQLEKENERKLEQKKRENERKLDAIRKKIKQENKRKLNSKKRELEQKYKNDAEILKEEIKNLENQITSLERGEIDDISDLKEMEEINKLKKDFMENEQKKFQLEKENLIRKINMETQELKEIEDKKFADKLKEIKKLNEEKLKVQQQEFDEEKYKKQLERKMEEKIEDYKKELSEKLEIQKLQIMDQLRDYEKNELSKMRLKINQEIREINDKWKREKESKENAFLLEKMQIEQQFQNDFLSYKQQKDNEFERKKVELERKSQEKLTALRQSVDKGANKEQAIKYVELQEKIQNLKKSIANQDFKIKEQNQKNSRYRNQLEDLNQQISKKKLYTSQSSKPGGMTELQNRVETLQQMVFGKEQEINQVKKEIENQEKIIPQKSMAYSKQSRNIFHQSQEKDIEILQTDLKNIKKFLQQSQVTSQNPLSPVEDQNILEKEYGLSPKLNFSPKQEKIPKQQLKETGWDVLVSEELELYQKQRKKLLRDLDFIETQLLQNVYNTKKQLLDISFIYIFRHNFLLHIKQLTKKKIQVLGEKILEYKRNTQWLQQKRKGPLDGDDLESNNFQQVKRTESNEFMMDDVAEVESINERTQDEIFADYNMYQDEEDIDIEDL